MTVSRQELDHPTSSSSSSTSPTTTVSSDSGTRAREDLCGVDSYPVSVSSKQVERKERGGPLTKPTKNPKSKKKKRITSRYGETCWILSGFKDNLVDDRVPERRDSHASSSHESFLEPGHAGSVDLGKRSAYSHFPKDRKILVWSQQITKFSVKVVNLEKSSICNRGAGLGHPMDRVVPVQNKVSQETHRSLQKSLEQNRKPKVIYTDNSLELGKVCEDFLESLNVNSTLGLLREQLAEWKKVLLQYCCNHVWMKIGGQILWNAVPIFETLKISCLMGKLHSRDVLRNHLRHRSFRLVHWLSYYTISAKDQSRIHQFGKKVFL